MYPARLDDKGRMKLPQTFMQYFASLREKTLFVTSLDRNIAAIYPMATWRQNEEVFYNYREDPDAAADVIFNAMDLGAETEMDAQGRIGFSPELRRTLLLEDKPLKIFAHKGRIQVLTEEIYEKQKQRASQSAEEKLRKLEAAGLK
jgi:DNA-binding transcriptional regulator/RsmH inhibitor MraZ